MRLGVIGLNEKVAELRVREKLAKVCQQHINVDVGAVQDIPLVLLSTCNRTEVYFSTEDLAGAHVKLLEVLKRYVDVDFDQKVYSFFGKDCLQHLARVAAGLDSAIIAETEIQGQVRASYEATAQRRWLPHELHFAFQKALKIGKQVRKELPLRRGIPDLEHAVLATAGQIFAQPEEAHLLFIGASEINHKILSFMKRKAMKHLSLCNRSSDAAIEIAAKLDIDVVPWQAVSTWRDYDWVIFGTKAPDYLVSLDTLYDNPLRTKLMIDLSVPRNVDPAIASCAEVSLVNIDQLHHTLQARRDSLAPLVYQAEELVADAADRLAHSFQIKRQKVPTLEVVHAHD